MLRTISNSGCTAVGLASLTGTDMDLYLRRVKFGQEVARKEKDALPGLKSVQVVLKVAGKRQEIAQPL